MKKSLIILMQVIIVMAGFMACKTDGTEPIKNLDNDFKADSASTDTTGKRSVSIKVGTRTFTATLANNATAAAFAARLPLTITMNELNGNEKLYRFPANLPSDPSNPGTIQNGDLMLYTSNTLVVFYKSFPTSYTYTRIGKVNDVSGLTAALGSGRVEVSFALE